MKNSTKLTTGLLALSFLVAGQAYAMPGQDNGGKKGKWLREQLTTEQVESVKTMRESGDDKEAIKAQLEEWGVEKPGKTGKFIGKVFGDQLTEDEKETLKELKDAGDRDAVKAQIEAYADAYGVELPEPKVKLTEEQKEAAKAALESGDYTAYVEVSEEIGRDEVMSEDAFDKVAEANDLREAGEYEEARDIIKELKESGDLKKGFGHKIKKMFGKMFGKKTS